MAKTGPKTFRWNYDSFIDWMLANPDKRQADMARHFEVTESWLSQVIHSDVFQEKWRQRRNGFAARVDSTLVEKLEAIGHVALDRMAAKLEDKDTGDLVPISTLLETSSMVMKSLGFTAPKDGRGGSQSHLHLHVGSDDLARARELMRQRQLQAATEGEDEPTGVEILPPAKRLQAG